MALAEDKGASQWQGFGLAVHGWTSSLLGNATEAIQSLKQGMDALMSSGSRVFNPIFFTALARAHIQSGDFSEARACVARAFAHIEQTNERFVEAEVYRTAGELALAGPDQNIKQAELSLQRSLAIARSQKAKSWELRTATSLARLWLDQGRSKEARKTLGAIYGSFTEGFDTPDLQRAKELLVELDG